MKRWKLSYKDFRNRAHWAEYETAIEDMMAETSRKRAPWRLIPANNRPYRRVAAFRILADRLGKDVSLALRPLDPNLIKRAKAMLGLSSADFERASGLAAPKAGGNRRRSGDDRASSKAVKAR